MLCSEALTLLLSFGPDVEGVRTGTEDEVVLGVFVTVMALIPAKQVSEPGGRMRLGLGEAVFVKCLIEGRIEILGF